MTRAYSVFGAFVLTILIAADPRAGSLGPLRWEPDGIPVDGGGTIPFFGGIGSRDLYGPRYRLGDLDDDGDFDLFVLDRDGRIATLSNVGSGASPRFFPQSDDLLGAPLTDWFLFADIDADGDLDLFGGRMPGDLAIGYFENVGGSSSPDFEGRPGIAFLDSLQAMPLGTVPSLADMDGDGDLDLFYVEPIQGISVLHENLGTPAQPSFGGPDLGYGGVNTFEFPKLEGPERSGHETAAHGFTIPTLLDCEGDGDQDLLIGDILNPSLWHFYNDGGTDSAEFVLVAHEYLDLPGDSLLLGLVWSEPADLDGDGLTDLLVGPTDLSAQLMRPLYFYRGNDSCEFAYAGDTLVHGIDFGSRAMPALGDLDDDGDLDLVLSRVVPPGKQGLFLLENVGTPLAPSFRVVTESNPISEAVHPSLDSPAPALADIDADGDLDLFAGQEGAPQQVHFFENQGTPAAADFVHTGTVLDSTNIRRRPNFLGTPTLGDLDHDGDLDLLVGEFGSSFRPQIYWYRNLGTFLITPQGKLPRFEWVTSNADSAFGFDTVADSVTSFLAPFLIDTNGDSLLDLWIGAEDGRLREYENQEAGGQIHFGLADNFVGSIDVGRASAIAIADIDADKDLDIVVGEENGGVNFYRNLAETVSAPGTPGAQARALEVVPNPVAGAARVIYRLGPEPLAVHLAVFDVAGRRIETLLSGDVVSGTGSVTWGGAGEARLSPGIYVLRLTAGGQVHSKRITVIR